MLPDRHDRRAAIPLHRLGFGSTDDSADTRYSRRKRGAARRGRELGLLIAVAPIAVDREGTTCSD